MNNINDSTPLFDAIVKYIDRNPSYFRIPGHRGAKGISPKWVDLVGENIFKFDLTETPYLDDLHNPSGAIAKAQNLAKNVFGSDKTYFLVKWHYLRQTKQWLLPLHLRVMRILVPRNAHKSVFNGTDYKRCNTKDIMPKYLKNGCTRGN